VEEGTVSDRISLAGTAGAISESTVAAEISGIVDSFPVKEGNFFQKGDLLVELRSIEQYYLRIRNASHGPVSRGRLRVLPGPRSIVVEGLPISTVFIIFPVPAFLRLTFDSIKFFRKKVPAS
jgi:hypothetical protein